MALRLVSSNKVKIELEDNDWIEVKEDLSRREFNRLFAPLRIGREGIDTDSIDLESASAFSEGLFTSLVTDWSLRDSKGKAVPANLENYQNLSRESSQIIDAALTEHFNSMIAVSDTDAQKSEEPSV